MTDSSARYPSLRDRHVFITGGSSGIEAELVRGFVAQGSRVTTVDIAEPQDLTPGVSFETCDVRDVRALEQAIEDAVRHYGPIRALVNNVARDDRFDSSAMTVDEWDEMLAVNLRHVFFASQAVRSGMAKAGGGAIVNFMSPSPSLKQADLAAYATAKSGIWGLTRTLAGQMGRDLIRVNAVQPGWVLTERQRRLWWTPDAEATVLEGQAIPVLTSEADIARAVLFLTSDDAAMISAQVLVVDGGWT